MVFAFISSTVAENNGSLKTDHDPTVDDSMVKLVLLLTRRADLDADQFFEYWRTVHASYVAQIPELRRYVISVRTEGLAGESMPDGMAELWFDNVDALRRAMQSEGWIAAREDGPNFRKNSVSFVTEEHELLSDIDALRNPKPNNGKPIK